MGASERIVWPVMAMDVQPRDRVLEVGCGHGVAVTLICERLNGGQVTAIDRSKTMTDMASARNAEHVAAGRAMFETVALAQTDFGRRRFDKVLGIHVGLFIRANPARELAVIAKALAPRGRLYLAYQPLAAREVAPTIATLSRVLEGNGFAVEKVLRTETIPPTPMICVIAGKAR